MTQALTKIVTDYKLDKTMGQSLVDTFKPYFETVAPLLQQAKTCLVDDPDDAEGIERSRVLWKAIKDARCEAENKAEAMRRPAMDLSKAIAFAPKLLAEQTKPVEERLYAQWKLPETREKEKKTALAKARADELRPFTNPGFYQLGDMTEDQYQEILAMAKAARQKALDDAKRLEEQRARRQYRITELQKWGWDGRCDPDVGQLAEADFLMILDTVKEQHTERKAQELAERERQRKIARAEVLAENGLSVEQISEDINRLPAAPAVETPPQPQAKIPFRKFIDATRTLVSQMQQIAHFKKMYEQQWKAVESSVGEPTAEEAAEFESLIKRLDKINDDL